VAAVVAVAAVAVVVEIGRRKSRKKARKAGCKSTSIRVPVSSFVTHDIDMYCDSRKVVHVGTWYM
jgi:hypothetical protein